MFSRRGCNHVGLVADQPNSLRRHLVLDLVRGGNVLAVPKCRTGRCLRVGKRSLVEKLDEIFGKKNVQRPIDRHAHFLFDARQFAPVNPTPEKPGYESREIYTEDSCDSRASANRSKRPERLEPERLFRRALNARHDVLRNDFAFTGCSDVYETSCRTAVAIRDQLTRRPPTQCDLCDSTKLIATGAVCSPHRHSVQHSHHIMG